MNSTIACHAQPAKMRVSKQMVRAYCSRSLTQIVQEQHWRCYGLERCKTKKNKQKKTKPKTYGSWLVEMLDAKLQKHFVTFTSYFLYTCYLNSWAALWVRISSIVMFHPRNQSYFIQILQLSIRPRITIQSNTVLIPY